MTPDMLEVDEAQKAPEGDADSSLRKTASASSHTAMPDVGEKGMVPKREDDGREVGGPQRSSLRSVLLVATCTAAMILNVSLRHISLPFFSPSKVVNGAGMACACGADDKGAAHGCARSTVTSARSAD